MLKPAQQEQLRHEGPFGALKPPAQEQLRHEGSWKAMKEKKKLETFKKVWLVGWLFRVSRRDETERDETRLETRQDYKRIMMSNVGVAIKTLGLVIMHY